MREEKQNGIRLHALSKQKIFYALFRLIQHD